MPKTHSLEIDWRINPSFCISPFPNLPWKGDWADPSQDRSQSLTAYPLFERKPDGFQWKSMPGVYRDSVYGVEEPGADYLFAYWFARWTGVIDATD